MTSKPPDIRRTPVQTRSKDREQSILEATRRLLAKGGVDALTTTRIARTAKVPVGSVYYLFPNKYAILVKLLEWYMDRVIALLQLPDDAQPWEAQIADQIDRLAAKDLDRILVAEIVPSLDGIEHVPLPGVRFDISQSGADSPLRGSGMRSRRIEFAHDGDSDSRNFRGRKRRHKPRPAGAHNHRIELMMNCLTHFLNRPKRQNNNRSQNHKKAADKFKRPMRLSAPSFGSDIIIDQNPNPVEAVKKRQKQHR